MLKAINYPLVLFLKNEHLKHLPALEQKRKIDQVQCQSILFIFSIHPDY